MVDIRVYSISAMFWVSFFNTYIVPSLGHTKAFLVYMCIRSSSSGTNFSLLTERCDIAAFLKQKSYFNQFFMSKIPKCFDNSAPGVC